MTTLLALSDGWIIGLGATQAVVNVALTLGIFLLRHVTQRMDSNVKRMDTLEDVVRVSTERLIESKLAGVAQQLEGCVDVLNERITGIRDRLAKGDGDFDALDKRDRELEARFIVRFDSLKDYLHANFATKVEVQENFRGLHKRIDQIKGYTTV